jgi:hypothetical protein
MRSFARNSPWFARLGVGFLLAYSIVTLVSVVGQAALTNRTDTPTLPAPSEDQLVALRRLLPPCGTVGFISTRIPTSSWEYGGARFFWTQFDLAPLVLDLSPGHAVVLVSCGDGPASLEAGTLAGLTLESDLGGGLMVFKRP